MSSPPPEDEREDEDEELMFSFEPDTFRSLSELPPLPRPSNPLAAVLAQDQNQNQQLAPVFRSFADDFNGRRKRSREPSSSSPSSSPFQFPAVVTPVVRPIPKRARLDARSATAPASFMRAPSPAGQPLSRSSSNEPSKDKDKDKEEDKGCSFRPLSASIAIPGASFRPIRPASTGLVGSTHSSASASSAKSWAGNFCRRSLDVGSPVRTRLSDLVISSSGSREGS